MNDESSEIREREKGTSAKGKRTSRSPPWSRSSRSPREFAGIFELIGSRVLERNGKEGKDAASRGKAFHRFCRNTLSARGRRYKF